MRSLTLQHIKETSGLTDLEAAVALYQLFSGNFRIEGSKDTLNALRQQIHRAKTKCFFKNFKNFLVTYSITDILRHFTLSANFWHCPNNGTPKKNLVPTLVKTISTVNHRGVVNLLVDRKTFSIENNDSFHSRLRLIVDHDYMTILRDQMKSFRENVEIFVPGSSESLAQWPNSFSIFDERKFANILNLGFEIWVVHAKFCPKNEEVVVANKRVYKSTQSDFIVLQFVGPSWPNDKENITQSDLFILRTKSDFEIFKCSNNWCFYNTTCSRDFDEHFTSCKNATTVKYKQIAFTNESPKEYLLRTKAIPAFESFNLVSFDIETLNDPENRQISEFTFLKSTHKLLSISVSSNFSGCHTKVFIREDFSEGSLMKTVHDFWAYLVELQIEHQKSFPPEFQAALDTINAKIAEKPAFQASSLLSACQHYLRNLFALKVVTFNGERFDVPIIFPALLKLWNLKSSTNKFDPLSVVRRGLGIMTVEFRQIRFVDVRNFFPSGNLDKFGKIFKVEDVKLCFPYEEYKNIEELKQATEWPPFSAFGSTISCYNDISKMKDRLKIAFLKAHEFFQISCMDFFDQLDIYEAFTNFTPTSEFPENLVFSNLATQIFSTDPVLYVESWIKFEELKILGECENMFDYIRIYNAIDTKVTTAAFTKMVKLFSAQFGENLLDYPSIPGVAYRVMWKHYSLKINKPFSFGPEFGWIAKEIRDHAIQGGLCVPMHR